MVGVNQLAEFWDRCDRFDWHYEMSDSVEVYRAGLDGYIKLCVAALEMGNVAEEILEEFKLHHYSGEAFESSKHPKPERPRS
jgi:hypothetical protein